MVQFSSKPGHGSLHVGKQCRCEAKPPAWIETSSTPPLRAGWLVHSCLIGAGVTSAPLGRLDPHDYSRHPLRTVIRCPVRISTPQRKRFSGAQRTPRSSGLLYCGAGVGVALIRRFVRPMLSISRNRKMALRHGDLLACLEQSLQAVSLARCFL